MWVWLLVPLRVCGYHRNGEEKVRWLKNWVISNRALSKSRCVRKLESCVSISPFRGGVSCGQTDWVGLVVPH